MQQPWNSTSSRYRVPTAVRPSEDIRDLTASWFSNGIIATKAVMALAGNAPGRVAVQNHDFITVKGVFETLSAGLRQIADDGNFYSQSLPELLVLAGGNPVLSFTFKSLDSKQLMEIKAFTLSDSTLLFGTNTELTKADNRGYHMVYKHLADSEYAGSVIRSIGGATAKGLFMQLEEWGQEHAGGDPRQFKHHLTLYHMANEVCRKNQVAKRDFTLEDVMGRKAPRAPGRTPFCANHWSWQGRNLADARIRQVGPGDL